MRRVHGTRLAWFALFFTHDHESVKRKSVSREMYTFLGEVKLRPLGRQRYEDNDIRDKNLPTFSIAILEAIPAVRIFHFQDGGCVTKPAGLASEVQ